MVEKFIKLSDLEKLVEDLKLPMSTHLSIVKGIKKAGTYTAEGHWHTYVGPVRKCYKIVKEEK